MTDADPNGTVAIRLRNIERWMDRIDNLEPAVMKAELRDVKDDIHQIANDVQTMRREMSREIASVRALLTKFFIATTIALVSGVIYVLVASGTH